MPEIVIYGREAAVTVVKEEEKNGLWPIVFEWLSEACFKVVRD